ncbi:MAG: glutamine synthetase III [Planctomycetes bacterium]|nr:glutamine synthetase III [Planctomycetota bacterium]
MARGANSGKEFNDQSEQVTNIFGENVFNLAVMRERLPKNVFNKLLQANSEGSHIDPATADIMANAMKDWAIERGATHYCHWFQPMTGMTAEKHDSFISPTADGRTIMEFSGRELIQGEPDASSFPSGGLRATFEARGYTAWDCTNPVFIKEDGKNITMFIPSAFCSYTGEALDKKTPLLRSNEALNKQALRILRALGNTTAQRVLTTLGSEQEYFLVDRDFVEARLDLLLTGRTLFGAAPPKGQEMSDHYFGHIHERVASFMNELNIELWRLGVSAKTQHNEVAPGQYEIAPVFSTVNVATDHNQLTMETLQKVATRRGFVCLLHEKPFAGLNGSGKHNNWSMVTDEGLNLLNPGKTPKENEIFLVFLCAVIRAVDKYSDLLRASVTGAGNDQRLGGHEAPPAIISIFLGQQLTEIVEQFEFGSDTKTREGGQIQLGVSTLPPLPKDLTDRNRTSPFAFTGNRFEFRMVGSSASTADPNFILNSIVAEVLAELADEFEKTNDVNKTAQNILKRIIHENKKVIFNGDNYCEAWIKEAASRGLPNLKDSVEALQAFMTDKAVELFEKHKVLSKGELAARQDIFFEHYAQTTVIEGQTALRMAKRQILPAAMEFSSRVAMSVTAIKEAGADPGTHAKALEKVCALISDLQNGIDALTQALEATASLEGSKKRASSARDTILPAMATLRSAADSLELEIDADLWPLPTYAEMLFMR